MLASEFARDDTEKLDASFHEKMFLLFCQAIHGNILNVIKEIK